MQLSPQTINRGRGMPPGGEQLADAIRDAIRKNKLLPGEELDSIQDIGRAINASRPVVRRALDILENEGLILRHAGLRTKVAHRPTPRILNGNRYIDVVEAKAAGAALTTSAFADEHGVALDAVVYDPITYTQEPASAEDAYWLGIKPGTKVLRRQWVKCILDDYGVPRPKEIQTSVIALKRVNGTDFMKPEIQPVAGGILAELLDLGYTDLGWADEEWSGRPPTGEEKAQLRMETVDSVSVQFRVFVASDDTPIEYSITIRPMAETKLRLRTYLSRDVPGKRRS